MTTTISSVPSNRWDALNDRSASSVTNPPALRMMCASPRCSPSIGNKSMRVSMHASTATLRRGRGSSPGRSEEHTSELQSRQYLVCRLLLEKKTNLLNELQKKKTTLITH